MKKIIFCIWMFFPVIAFGNTFTQIQINEHTVQYISYKSNSQHYDIRVGISEEGSHLREILGDYGGVSGINGVFFCPADYPHCQGKNFTINERFIEGRELSTYETTGERVVFGWNTQQEAFLYQTNRINADKKPDIYEGLANFPLLLESGKNTLEHYYDIGLIDAKMRSKISRHFICTNESRDTIHFGRVTYATLDDVVKSIRKIGCYDALNLDAGGSSSFIYNGRNIVGPGRDVIDGVVIIPKNIDIQTINTSVQKVSQEIERIYLSKRNTQKAIEKLQQYRNTITKIRQNIYQKYSQDVFDTQEKIVGYSINITKTSDLKKMYILNTLDNSLKEIIKKLQK